MTVIEASTTRWTDGSSDTDSAWDEFVAATPGGHHAQTSAWGRSQAHRGWDATRLEARDKAGALVGGAQVLTRAVTGLGRVGYLDGGPLLRSDDRALLDDAVMAMRQFAHRERVRLLIVQPPDDGHELHRRMRTGGFGASHLKTSLAATTVLDLTLGADELLARMKSKTRYNVRLGLRSDVKVRRGDRDDVEVFHSMLEKTAERQGFIANSMAHLADLYEVLGPMGQIFIAEHDGRPIAGMLAIAFGDTVVYKRGAWSGEEGKRRPNEVMHWEAIRWAIDEGYERYDFDGIEPEAARAVLDDRKLPPSTLESVTRFKLGFGGSVVLRPETSSYLPNRLLRVGHDHVYSRVAELAPVKRLVKRMRVG